MANKKTVKTENKTIELTIEQIEKSFGKGAVMRMNESGDMAENIQAISTGSIGLDLASVSYTHLTLPTKRIV